MTAAPSTLHVALSPQLHSSREGRARELWPPTENLLLSRAKVMAGKTGNLEVGLLIPSRRKKKIRTTTEACLQETAVCFTPWKTTDSQISALGELCPWKSSGQGLQKCLWCVHRALALWNGGVREDG